jgi:tetratricopeptide (TPR) repeat protein
VVPRSKTAVVAVAILLAVTATYANHFHNAFQFDDFHTIRDNVYIRNLTNIPRFFSDATMSSVLPANQSWRPLVTASLALDYHVTGDADTFYFHLSTFLWFLTVLLLMGWLFSSILDRVEPDRSHLGVAWFATAYFGLHPAIAETVNYIIQRADVMSTWGVVAGLALYAGFPSWRRRGLYLVPVAIGLLSKPPALIFPAILGAYLFLIEEGADRSRWGRVVRNCLPAVGLSLAFLALQAALTPRSFTAGAGSAWRYFLTQPYVWFRCFTSFFLPVHLSADTDLAPLETVFSLEAVGGLLFVAALGTAIYLAAKRPAGRPAAFGLAWFALGLIPTSVFPLAEVENDHRMFLPFVGLALAVSWTAAWLLTRKAGGRDVRIACAAGAACLLLVCAAGTRRRNEVWRTPESLWGDVVLKSPRNGRGLMNYGLARMSAGDFAGALSNFERALQYTPNYPQLEINLGIDCAALGRDAEAERHFQRALTLAPAAADSRVFYGRWLAGKGRRAEAAAQLRAALAANPARLDARGLLMQTYADQADWADLRPLAVETLGMAPDDPVARRFASAATEGAPAGAPETLVNLSLDAFQKKDFEGCIRFAQAALRLRAEYAEAYTNIAAANNELGRWDDAIRAGREAVKIRPEFQLARNNLAWAVSQKLAATKGLP